MLKELAKKHFLSYYELCLDLLLAIKDLDFTATSVSFKNMLIYEDKISHTQISLHFQLHKLDVIYITDTKGYGDTLLKLNNIPYIKEIKQLQNKIYSKYFNKGDINND